MKIVVAFILATLAGQVLGGLGIIGMTKERAMSKVTVRLVRRDWRPVGFNPDTDEALASFPGTVDELKEIIMNARRNMAKFGMVKEPLISAKNLFDSPHYNATQPTLVLTHPITIGDSLFISCTVLALSLRNLQKHYNIFAMHAPWLSSQFQTSCARTALGLEPYFKPVAEAYASFLFDGMELGKIKPHQISLMGFSYSGTLCAYIARLIKEKTRHRIHTLMTLDAYQYNPNHNPHFSPITEKDARYVHLIHTSGRYVGTMRRNATVDLVINNGFWQPGCSLSAQAGAGCSHRRSVMVFLFGLITTGNLVGRRCDSWEDFSECKCDDADHPLLLVSFPVNEEVRGTFYMRTSGEAPFVQGVEGAYCKNKEKIEDKENKKTLQKTSSRKQNKKETFFTAVEDMN